MMIKLEAISPNQSQPNSPELRIWYGIHETPFGNCLIARTDRGICNLSFFDLINTDIAQENLARKWVNAEIIWDQIATQAIIDQIFNPVVVNSNPLIALVDGSNFQIQVWQELLKIPFGKITTYQSLAQAIANPDAARAVGNALSKNPIAYLIPCHRVIRTSGDLGGYRWGWERKRAMLSWETSRN